MLKLFYTRRVPLADCGRFAPSACWCLNVPVASNLSRMSCSLCALVVWSMPEAPQMCVYSALSASASIFCRRRFTNRRAGLVWPKFTIDHTSPSWKSSGRHIAASLSSLDAQPWLFSKIWLMSARTDGGIAVVASSMAYTRTHSCFARFPTLASSRASAPLYPYANKPARTGHTLKTQKSIEATVRSHDSNSVSVGCVATRAKSPVLHSKSVTHHRTASPAQIQKKKHSHCNTHYTTPSNTPTATRAVKIIRTATHTGTTNRTATPLQHTQQHALQHTHCNTHRAKQSHCNTSAKYTATHSSTHPMQHALQKNISLQHGCVAHCPQKSQKEESHCNISPTVP